MPTQHLDNIINAFDPIHLDEMNGTALMNRVDTKFVITFNQLLTVLPELKKHYRILDINGLRLPSYESEYYDSRSLDFYIDHHRKKVDRFKVRFRKYVESDLSFLEVKHKSSGFVWTWDTQIICIWVKFLVRLLSWWMLPFWIASRILELVGSGISNSIACLSYE